MAMQRTLWWIASTLGGGALMVADRLAAGRLTGGRRLPLILVVAALLLLMRVWLGVGQSRLDRLVGRRRRDLDAEMAQLTDSAATLQTTEELGRAVDRFLVALDRRLSALVVLEPSGRPRVTWSAWGSVPAPARTSPLFADLVPGAHPGLARSGARQRLRRDPARLRALGRRVPRPAHRR